MTQPLEIGVPDSTTFEILYTNDLHGQIENLARISTVVKEKRKESPDLLLVDSGDWSRGSFVSNQFKGLPMAEAMSVMKYDAVGIGEGELFWGLKALEKLAAVAKFPILAANLAEARTGQPVRGLKDWIVVEKKPYKVGITALSPPLRLNSDELSLLPPMGTLKTVLEEMEKEKPDVSILLSQLGLDADKEIAAKFPNINVIVSGRTHENLEEPIRVGNTFIVQSGADAKFLGSLSIEFGTIVRISSKEEE